jgi:hypothetical protein
MSMMTWSAIAMASILAATDVAASSGMGMMGAANAMMQRIQAAAEDAGGASGEGKGIACLPDSQRFMVTKVVDGDLWLVTWDAHMGMGDISGNVVMGDRVVFLHCPVTGVTGPDPENDSLLMSCDVGDGVVPRSGWHHLEDVTLPGRFFLP